MCYFNLENDQEVGITDVDDKVGKPKLTPAEIRENEMILQLFKHVAGKKEEIGWGELKTILDAYTKKEEPAIAMNMDSVGAAPEQGQQGSDENNLLTAILRLLCGALCKDTPLADIVPAPTQDVPLNDPYFETKNKGFSKDNCRSMIAMLDINRSGKLNFEEFKRLWRSITIWKNVFKKHDVNQSGQLNGFELREAFKSAGYTLNNHTLNILMHRYGNKVNEIEFDDFIMCAVKLKLMIELFTETAKKDADTATFTLEDWIETTLYT